MKIHDENTILGNSSNRTLKKAIAYYQERSDTTANTAASDLQPAVIYYDERPDIAMNPTDTFTAQSDTFHNPENQPFTESYISQAEADKTSAYATIEQISSSCLAPFLSKDLPFDETTNEVPANERLAAPALVARIACPAGSGTPPTPPTSTMQPTVVEEKRKRANGADLANTLVATVYIHIYDDSIYLFKNGWYQRQTENDLNRLIRHVCQVDIQQIGTRRIFDDTKALLLADSKLLAEPYRGSELVCVLNGLYEIATGKLYPHDPRYFFTSCVNVQLPQPITNMSPSTPAFDSFLDYAMGGNPQLIERVYQMFGYILANDIKGKVFFLIQGISGSGKSVLLSVLEAMYDRELVSTIVPGKLGERFTGSGLIGKVVNIAGDIPDRPLPQEAAALIKALTGRDTVTVEEKYKALSHLDPMVRFVFATNFPFRLSSDDAALRERLVVIPFIREVPRDMQNPDLDKLLWAERAGVFLKAMAAYRRLKQDHYRFAGQEIAVDQANIYVGRLAQADATVQEFLHTACILDHGSFTSTRVLYETYQQFCLEQGILGIDNPATFSRMLHSLCGEKAVLKKRRRGDCTVNGYEGLRLIGMPEGDTV